MVPAMMESLTRGARHATKGEIGELSYWFEHEDGWLHVSALLSATVLATALLTPLRPKPRN